MSISVFITIIQLPIQLMGLGFKATLLGSRYAFQICSGLLIAFTLPHEQHIGLDFIVGVSIAFSADLLLRQTPLISRQIIFGGMGLLTGLILAIQVQAAPFPLVFLPLMLSGLCLRQAHSPH